MHSTEPGTQHADPVVLVAAEVGTVMTKQLPWKKSGIIKDTELAQNLTARKGES